MDIYHYHPETGAFLGQGRADQDPKSSIRFLIPAHATKLAPPPPAEGSIRVFRNQAWGYVPFNDVAEEPSNEPVPVNLAAYAAERRWLQESSGCKWSGLPVHSDRDSRSNITAERLAVVEGTRADPDVWKFADGVIRMVSNEEFIDLSNTVRDFVRNCFAREAEVLAAIAAGDVTTKEEINAAFADVSAAWPAVE